MKHLKHSSLLSMLLFYGLAVTAQTPYFSVIVKMDSAKTEGKRYKIEMKFCHPSHATDKGDWFKADTSNVDFANLKPGDVICNEYFDKGMPEVILGKEEEIPVNQFKFTNQVFAWEQIVIVKISDQSSRGWHPEMYIVFPVKYKSFVTYISLSDIDFLSGNVLFADNYAASKKGMSMSVDLSLKDHPGINVKDFSLREVLEAK